MVAQARMDRQSLAASARAELVREVREKGGAATSRHQCSLARCGHVSPTVSVHRVSSPDQRKVLVQVVPPRARAVANQAASASTPQRVAVLSPRCCPGDCRRTESKSVSPPKKATSQAADSERLRSPKKLHQESPGPSSVSSGRRSPKKLHLETPRQLLDSDRKRSFKKLQLDSEFWAAAADECRALSPNGKDLTEAALLKSQALLQQLSDLDLDLESRDRVVGDMSPSQASIFTESVQSWEEDSVKVPRVLLKMVAEMWSKLQAAQGASLKKDSSPVSPATTADTSQTAKAEASSRGGSGAAQLSSSMAKSPMGSGRHSFGSSVSTSANSPDLLSLSCPSLGTVESPGIPCAVQAESAAAQVASPRSVTLPSRALAKPAAFSSGSMSPKSSSQSSSALLSPRLPCQAGGSVSPTLPSRPAPGGASLKLPCPAAALHSSLAANRAAVLATPRPRTRPLQSSSVTTVHHLPGRVTVTTTSTSTSWVTA
eukprot:TRINITY_DN13643_c0_g1_i2.p1 TRINITY_DN13643_c0_g1~~TRINITY_DN13643_c0_g1_i2.p1  ORF type:complete len:487 (+),score=71.24 TRINITY_DN13643_c0_g1_i2:80-1540(+)